MAVCLACSKHNIITPLCVNRFRYLCRQARSKLKIGTLHCYYLLLDLLADEKHIDTQPHNMVASPSLGIPCWFPGACIVGLGQDQKMSTSLERTGSCCLASTPHPLLKPSIIHSCVILRGLTTTNKWTETESHFKMNLTSYVKWIQNVEWSPLLVDVSFSFRCCCCWVNSGPPWSSRRLCPKLPSGLDHHMHISRGRASFLAEVWVSPLPSARCDAIHKRHTQSHFVRFQRRKQNLTGV